MAREQVSLVTVKEDEAEASTQQVIYQCHQVFFADYEPSCLQKCSNKIIQVLEIIFYKWVVKCL